MNREETPSHDRRSPEFATSNSLWSLRKQAAANELPMPTITANSLPALFVSNASRSRSKPFAVFRDFQTGIQRTVTWEQAAREVYALTIYLRDKAHVKKGSKIAIVSATRYEWLVADLAIQFLGCVSCSVYHSLTPAEVGFILVDSDVSVVFAENKEQVEKLVQISTAPFPCPATESGAARSVKLPLSRVIAFESADAGVLGEKLVLYRTLTSVSTLSIDEILKELERVAQPITRDTLASFVYTSGTTGAPKGVMQTHGNHIEMLQAAFRSGLLGQGDGIFLYLPLAHSFARLVAYAALGVGGDLIFPTVVDRTKSTFHPPQIFKDLAASNPTLFPSVPRLFEKVMDSMQSPEERSAKIAKWALDKTRELSPFEEAGAMSFVQKAQLKIARKILQKARRAIFGERLRYCISGGAPISVEVLEFFKILGVLICEGYGLTETTPAIAANIPEAMKFGTVGKLFDCNEVRIASDGEIEVKGGNVAKGYWKLPLATKEAWDDESWFRTGDIGEIDEEGFLKITDRKKDLIVTAGGKKIPPAHLEGKLKNSPIISQALVYGDRRSYLVALVTLNEQGIRAWLKSQELPADQPLKALAEEPRVTAAVEAAVKKINDELASFEQVKRFRILPEDFTLESGLLTPSLKLKRKAAVERFAKDIEALYQEKYDG